MGTEETKDPFKGVDWKAVGGDMQKDPGAKPVIKKQLPKKIRQIPECYFLPQRSLPSAIGFYGACIAGGIGAGMLLEIWINKKVKVSSVLLSIKLPSPIMADAIVNDLLKQLASIPVQLAKEEIKLIVGVDEEVQELKHKHRIIQAMLDNEERQLKQHVESPWLARLKDAYYKMDDVLDSWNTARIKSTL
ncbi:krueppel-like factor [Fagus crenata]